MEGPDRLCRPGPFTIVIPCRPKYVKVGEKRYAATDVRGTSNRIDRRHSGR